MLSREVKVDLAYVYVPAGVGVLGIIMALNYITKSNINAAIWALIAAMYAISNVLLFGLDKATEETRGGRP